MTQELQTLSYNDFQDLGIYSMYLEENPYDFLEDDSVESVWEKFKKDYDGDYNFVDPTPINELTDYSPNPGDINTSFDELDTLFKESDEIVDSVFQPNIAETQEAKNPKETKVGFEYKGQVHSLDRPVWNYISQLPKEEIDEMYNAYSIETMDYGKKSFADFLNFDARPIGFNLQEAAANEKQRKKLEGYNKEKEQLIKSKSTSAYTIPGVGAAAGKIGYEDVNVTEEASKIFDKSEEGYRLKKKWGLLTVEDNYNATIKGYTLEDAPMLGNPFQLLTENAWLSEDKRNMVKMGINQGVVNMIYSGFYKEDAYDIPEDYEPDWFETTGASMISLIDPTSIFGTKLIMMLGQTATRKIQETGIKMLFSTNTGLVKYGQPFYQKISPFINRYIPKWLTKHVSKSLPKTTLGYKVADFTSRKLPRFILEKSVPHMTTMAMLNTSHGIFDSVRNQRLKIGKYENGTGDINPWDLTVDAFHGTKRGLQTGFISSVGNSALGRFGAWTNKRAYKPYGKGIMYGDKGKVLSPSNAVLQQYGFKVLNKISKNPLSQIGVTGLSFATSEFAFDSEARKTYYDENGNFSLTKTAQNLLQHTTLAAFYIGLYQAPPYIKKAVFPSGKTGLVRKQDNSFFEELNRNIKDAEKFKSAADKKNREVDPEVASLSQAVQNIQKNTGINLKTTYVKQHMDKSTQSVETVDGLQGINEILNDGYKIIQKLAIKDNDGIIVDYDLAKITPEESLHITHILPTAMEALAGYKQEFLESEEGKQEYIKMYEEDNNVKLSEPEKKNVLNALQKDIDRFDLLIKEKNDIIKGLDSNASKPEPVSDNKLSDLDAINKENKVSVVIAKNGQPVIDENGKIQSFNMDKEDAAKYKESGEIMYEKDVDYDAIIGSKPTKNQSVGQKGLDPGQFRQIVREELEGQRERDKPVFSSRFTEEQLADPQNLGPTWKQDALKRINISDALKNFLDTPKNQITTPYDIQIIDRIVRNKKPLNATKTYLEPLNSLLTFAKNKTGKVSIAQISKQDVYDWRTSLINQRKAKGAAPSLNQHEITMLNSLIGLASDGYMLAPVTKAETKEFSKEQLSKAYTTEDGQKSLPPNIYFLGEVRKIISDLSLSKIQNDERLGMAFKLSFIEGLVRDREINKLAVKHIIAPDPETGTKPYIDLITEVDDGGARKKPGSPRPLFLSTETYNTLKKIIKDNKLDRNDLLFPKDKFGSAKITKTLQENIPSDKRLTAKALRIAIKTFIERGKNVDGSDVLTGSEKQQYAIMAGHEPGEVEGVSTSQIRTRYTKKTNFLDIQKEQLEIVKKINKSLDEVIKNELKNKKDGGTGGGGSKTPAQKKLEIQLNKKQKTLQSKENNLSKMKEKGKDKTKSYAKTQDAITKIKNEIKVIAEKLKKFTPAIVAGAVGAAAGIPFAGLSIKDVSGDDNKVVKNVVNKTKNTDNISMEKPVYKKFVQSVRNVFNEFAKDMTPGEQTDFLKYLSLRAGIDKEIFSKKDIISVNASQEDLINFAESLSETAGSSKKETTKRYYKKLSKIEEAKNQLAAHNKPEKDFFKMALSMFSPEHPNWKNDIKNINQFDMTVEELSQLNAAISNEYGASVDPKFSYTYALANEQSTAKLFKTISAKTLKNYYRKSGFTQQVTAMIDNVISDLNKIGAYKEAKSVKLLKEDLINHYVYEGMVKNELNRFENDAYKILSQGEYAGTGIRKAKGVTQLGRKKFNEIKDILSRALDVERFAFAEKHIKENPSDVEFAKQFPAIEKLHYKVFDKNKKKQYGDKNISMYLRQDTPEAKLAERWYEFTNNIKNHIVNSMKLNMTNEQYKRFAKKYGVDWIEDAFYFTRPITKEFGEHFDINQRNVQKRIQKEAAIIATEKAKEAYNTKTPTDAQISEFQSVADMEASISMLSSVSYTGGALINPKVLFDRKMYLGERVYIDSENKWVDVHEYAWAAIGPGYTGAASKLGANLAYFPYLINLKGLPPTRHNIPKLLLAIEKNGGAFGEMLINQISQRTLMPIGNNMRQFGGAIKKATRINTYITRANLSWITNSTRNLMFGWRQNAMQFGFTKQFVPALMALSWAKRMDAKDWGILDMSLSKIQDEAVTLGYSYTDVAKWKNPGDKLLDFVFDRSRFPSTEEIVRTTAVLTSIIELPILFKDINTKPILNSHKRKIKNAEKRLKEFYELNDNEIEIFKAIGLGDAKLGWSGSIAGKDISEAMDKRFKGLENISYIKQDGAVKDISLLLPHERLKLQFDIDLLHQKLITMSHIKSHGTSDPLFGAYWMSQRVVKPFMMYKQFARQDFYNTARALKAAVREKSFDKIGGAIITTVVSGAGRTGDSNATFKILDRTYKYGGLLYLLSQLVSSADDPAEMDEGVLKKIASMLIRSNFGGDIADLAAMFTGHNRGAVDAMDIGFYVNTGALQIAEAVGLLFEAGKGTLKQVAEPDVTFYKSGYFGRKLRTSIPPKKASKDALKGIFSTYRGMTDLYDAYTKPYINVKNQIRTYQKDFKKFYGDISAGSFPEHIKQSELAGVDYAFEKMRVDKNGNIKNPGDVTVFCDAIKDAYNVAIETRMRLYGDDFSKAKKSAMSSIVSKLKSLNPILNGRGIYLDEKQLDRVRKSSILEIAEKQMFNVNLKRMESKLSPAELNQWIKENKPVGMSERELFFKYLEEKALRQDYKKDEYTSVLVKGEKMYNAKVDAFLLHWDNYVKTNISPKAENYQEFQGLVPFIAKKLGPEVQEHLEFLENYNKNLQNMLMNKSEKELKGEIFNIYPGAGELLNKFKPTYFKPENWKGHWQGNWNRAMYDKIIEEHKKSK